MCFVFCILKGSLLFVRCVLNYFVFFLVTTCVFALCKNTQKIDIICDKYIYLLEFYFATPSLLYKKYGM
jgi:hypothetical protein